MATKPTQKLDWIPDNTTNITDPTSLKTNGYTLNAIPLSSNHNWLFNRTSQWVDFIDTFYDEYEAYNAVEEAKVVSTNETISIGNDTELAAAVARLAEINYIAKGAELLIEFTGTYGSGKSLTINEIGGPGSIRMFNTTTDKIQNLNLENCSCKISIINVDFLDNTTGDPILYVENCRYVFVDSCLFDSCISSESISIRDGSFVNFSTNSLEASHTRFIEVRNSVVVSGEWTQATDLDITTTCFDIIGGTVHITGANQPYAGVGAFSNTKFGGEIIGILGTNQSLDTVTVTLPDQATLTAQGKVLQNEVNKVFNAYGREIPAGTVFEVEMPATTYAMPADLIIGSIYGCGKLWFKGQGSTNTHLNLYGVKFDTILCELQVSAFEVVSATNDGVHFLRCRDFELGGVDINTPSASGVEIEESSGLVQFCQIDNATIAINCELMSRIRSYNQTGTGNTTGNAVTDGAMIHEIGTQSAATTARSIASAGVIVQNAGALI